MTSKDFMNHSYKDLLAAYQERSAELKKLSYLLEQCEKQEKGNGDALVKKNEDKLISFIKETIEFILHNFDEYQQLQYINHVRKAIKESFNNKQDSAEKQAVYFKELQAKFESL